MTQPQTEKKTSVIVPAFNEADNMPDLFSELASALSDADLDAEIVLVDDGSTDRTVEIVRGIMARDSRVKLVQQANAGVAAARNLGLREARGSLIAPLDADDLWKPTKIERPVAWFLAAADADRRRHAAGSRCSIAYARRPLSCALGQISCGFFSPQVPMPLCLESDDSSRMPNLEKRPFYGYIHNHTAVLAAPMKAPNPSPQALDLAAARPRRKKKSYL